jgi:hypothetical protein
MCLSSFHNFYCLLLFVSSILMFGFLLSVFLRLQLSLNNSTVYLTTSKTIRHENGWLFRHVSEIHQQVIKFKLGKDMKTLVHSWCFFFYLIVRIHPCQRTLCYPILKKIYRLFESFNIVMIPKRFQESVTRWVNQNYIYFHLLSKWQFTGIFGN